MGNLFGTDGIRGIANIELTPELAFKLGRSAAFVLSNDVRSKIVIGKDPRISSDLLEFALISGICSTGTDVVRVGVMPTPAIAFLIDKLGATAGAVISASHNPAEFNGIKFFGESGTKLSGEKEDRIERYIEEDIKKRPVGSGIGRITESDDAHRIYKDFLKGTVKEGLKGLKIALDCANGATFEVGPEVIEEMGAEIRAFHNRPDGININLDCGSLHPDILKEHIIGEGFDAGLCFDGDGDRVIMLDEKGNILDGDFIIAICASYLKERGLLKNNLVITTVMSNLGFDIAMGAEKIDVIKTKVGDKYVLEKMVEKEASLGGEQSGHIIFLEHSRTGDGILTALQVINIMKASGKSLSELSGIMKKLPQVLINTKVSKKERYESEEDLLEYIATREKKLGNKGRILVRPSGTEPLIRVMVEAESEEYAKRIAEEIAEKIREVLG